MREQNNVMKMAPSIDRAYVIIVRENDMSFPNDNRDNNADFKFALVTLVAVFALVLYFAFVTGRI